VTTAYTLASWNVEHFRNPDSRVTGSWISSSISDPLTFSG
jgi:hypothetical protein